MTPSELDTFLARCDRHTAAMQSPPTLYKPMAPSERNLAHLEDCIDNCPMTPAAASLLWRRIAAMAAVLDYSEVTG